ncbi:MAG: hypothetical protein U0414_14175 [Polyangiaceae bacterium]
MKTSLILTTLALGSVLVACGGGGGGTANTPANANAKSGETAKKADAKHPENKSPEWWHSSVKIKNASSWAIHQLFLTPFDSTSWGEDQLGADTVKSGESLELQKIECDTYDIKLVDEQGDTCIVQDIDLCLQDASWTLDDKELVGCEVSTAVDGHADQKPAE